MMMVMDDGCEIIINIMMMGRGHALCWPSCLATSSMVDTSVSIPFKAVVRGVVYAVARRKIQ